MRETEGGGRGETSLDSTEEIKAKIGLAAESERHVLSKETMGAFMIHCRRNLCTQSRMRNKSEQFSIRMKARLYESGCE